MTKRCRKSILCRSRRGRCCLGGAVFVMLHFRHLRIALSSTEALRGVSTNSQRLSANQALHLSSMKAEHQTNRCCMHCLILLATVFRSARASCRGPCGGFTRRERLTLSSCDSSLRSPLLASSSDLSFYPRKWWPGTRRIFMVHLSCLNAYRTLHSSPSLPSSLSPSFALIGNRASYLAASFATTVCASKELYLTAAVAAHEHSRSPLFSTTTPAPPSVCSQDALASKIHPYYFDCFRLGTPAASPPGAPKHFGTCASSFPYSSSASPPSGQPLSYCLPWQPPPSIIQT